MLLLAQTDFLGDGLKLLADAGQVVIIAIALLYVVRNSGKASDQDNTLLSQLVNLVSSFKGEAENTRKVIEANSDTQSKLMGATNEQTSEFRLMRKAMGDYQIVVSDTIAALKEEIESLQQTTTAGFTAIADSLGQHAQERQQLRELLETINTAQGSIKQKLDELKPPPPPAPATPAEVN